MVDPRLCVKVDFWTFCTGNYKCGCFVMIKTFVLEHNLPYVQSDFTCNLGPMISLGK